jgi:hypothetical protein
MDQPGPATRLERILGVGLAEVAVRQWPQSGELIRGRVRIAEVESHLVGLRLGVGRRRAVGGTVVVEWSTDYGDGGCTATSRSLSSAMKGGPRDRLSG